MKILSQAANFAIRLVSIMALSRLLEPRDFGLVGMVTAITGVLNLFKDFGLSAASVQRIKVSREQMSTLFWINVLVGIALSSLSLSVAPVVGRFYHEPRIFQVTAALSLGFLFNALGVQHGALMEREMRFSTMALIDTAALVTSTAVGISLAVAGYGYWSLVAMTLCVPAVSSAGAWLCTSWIPSLPQRQVGMGSMMRFGGTVTLNGLIVYIAYNLEKVLLGRYWGANVVGLYSRAYQLAAIPTDNLNSATGGVVFATLSRLQNDPARLKSYFLKAYSLVLALTVPTTIIGALLADDLIMVGLGPKWKDAVPVFRLLCPTILIFAMTNPMAWLLFSTGRVVRSLKIGLAIAPIVITAYLLGLPYGPKGVALAYSIAMTLWALPHVAWCVHGTSISFRDVILTVSRPVLSGIGAAVLVLAFQLYGGSSLSPLLRLIVESGIFLLGYAGSLLYVMGEKTLYLDIIRNVHRGMQREREEVVTA